MNIAYSHSWSDKSFTGTTVVNQTCDLMNRESIRIMLTDPIFLFDIFVIFLICTLKWIKNKIKLLLKNPSDKFKNYFKTWKSNIFEV